MRKLKFLSVFVLLALLLSAGLSEGRAQEPVPYTTSDAKTLAYILDLLRRWGYEETYDETNYEKIKEEMRSLSAEETRLLLYLDAAVMQIFYPEGQDSPTVSSATQNYLLDLARRTLYDEIRPATDELKMLSEDEQRLFEDLLFAVQEVASGRGDFLLPGDEVKIIEVILATSEARGMSFIDIAETFSETELKAFLHSADIEIVPEETKIRGEWFLSRCPPGYAECTQVSFPLNTYRAQCTGFECVNASNFDRASNSNCELLGCDYRIQFFTTGVWKGIDGNTRKADCVADDAPHGLREEGGIWQRMDVSCGFGKATWCRTNGSYLREHLLLEP